MKPRIDWTRHLDSWKRSGQTVTQYCRQNDLNRSAFYQKARQANSRPGNALAEILIPGFSVPEEPADPIFEFRLEIPFRFHLRMNLNFGRKAT